MPKLTLIKGFDYTALPNQREQSMSAARWRERAAQIVKAGGKIRVEKGETYLHGPDARIMVEIYGYIGKVPGDTGETPTG